MSIYASVRGALLDRIGNRSAPEPQQLRIVDTPAARVRLVQLGGQLRRGRRYSSMPSEESLGATIREALHDIDTDHARERATLTAALDELRAQHDELADRLRVAEAAVPAAGSPEDLWLEVKVSEQGQRARHFARLYGRASATIGAQRDTIGRLYAERNAWRDTAGAERAEAEEGRALRDGVFAVADDIARVVAVEDAARGDEHGADRPQHARALIEVEQRLRVLLDDVDAEAPPAGDEVVDPADTAVVGDQLGADWVDAQALVVDGGCSTRMPSEQWVCTRSRHVGTQHVATAGGKVIAVWPNEVTA